MAIHTNLSFEAGSAGVATAWTLAVVSTYEQVADYNAALAAEPWERFESGWLSNQNYKFAFVPSDLDPAHVGTVLVDFVKTVENFEESWDGNESYLRALDSPEPDPAQYAEGYGPPTYHPWERFETGWDSNQDWHSSHAGVGTDLEAAVFDAGGVAEAFDSFESGAGWSAGYITDFVGVGTDLTAATFDGVGTAYEAFETVKLKVQVSIDPVGDSIIVNPHPFADADKVTFEADLYPAPIQAGRAYYVAFSGPYDFQIEPGVGVGTIDLLETAAGTIYAVADPTLYWVDKMTTTAF